MTSIKNARILNAVYKIAWPVVAANILQSVYNLTDMFWVGRLGAQAVAAISFSFPIIFLLVSLGAGTSVAGTILVAQYHGKNEKRNIDYIATQVLFMLAAISVFISVLGYFFSEKILVLMNASAEVLPLASAYLKISFVGLVFLFSFFVFQSLLRGVGEVKKPMFIVMGTVVLNFLADPVLIMGLGPIPAFGISGAACATIFTQGIASAIGLFMFLRGRDGIKIRLRNFSPNFALMKKIFLLGFPASVEHSTRAFSFSLMIFLVGIWGTSAVASYGVATRIMSFVIIPAVGVAMAVSALIGQSFGAGKIDQAEKIARLSATAVFGLLTFAGILFFVFAGNLISLFVPADEEIISSGALFLKITSLTFGFVGLQIVLGGAFRGSGNTFAAMVLTILNFIVLRILGGFFLSRYTGLREMGIWLSFPLSNLIGGACSLLWFLRGGWKKKKLTREFSAVLEESFPEI